MLLHKPEHPDLFIPVLGGHIHPPKLIPLSCQKLCSQVFCGFSKKLKILDHAVFSSYDHLIQVNLWPCKDRDKQKRRTENAVRVDSKRDSSKANHVGLQEMH